MNRRTLISACWAIAIGGLTFAVGSLSLRSEHTTLAALQALLMVLIMPGLLGAAGLAGNSHAFALAPAAVINALLQFGVCSVLILSFRHVDSGVKAARTNRRPPAPHG